MRFNLGAVVPSLDGWFGNHDWFIASAALQLYEMGAPNNALFSRGIGVFEIRWLASHTNWLEGTGSPNLPTMDGVAFTNLPSLLDPVQDLSLGVFTNNGADGPLTLPLSLLVPFVGDLRAATPTTLQFAPFNDSVGFTFLARSDPRADLRIALQLTVAAGPPPRISSIERVGTNDLAIRFATRSNWMHIVQSHDNLSTDPGTTWVNRFTIPAQPSNSQIEVSDTITNVSRFYRLMALP